MSMSVKLDVPFHVQKLLNASLTAGLDLHRASKAFGVSRKNAKKLRPYNGVSSGLDLSAAQLGVTPFALERQIVSEYRGGATTAALSGTYHTSYKKIQEILIKHNCPIRPARRPSGLDMLRRAVRSGVAFASNSVLEEAYQKARKV